MKQLQCKVGQVVILTDEITKAWSGFSVKQCKTHQCLKKESRQNKAGRTCVHFEIRAPYAGGGLH